MVAHISFYRSRGKICVELPNSIKRMKMRQDPQSTEQMLAHVRAELSLLSAQEQAVALNQIIEKLVAMQFQALKEREKVSA